MRKNEERIKFGLVVMGLRRNNWACGIEIIQEKGGGGRQAENIETTFPEREKNNIFKVYKTGIRLEEEMIEVRVAGVYSRNGREKRKPGQAGEQIFEA